jgi:hypothetical protein
MHITVAAAIGNWLEHRRSEVKSNTMKGYEDGARLIIRRLLIGATPKQGKLFTETGQKPEGAKFVPLLHGTKITD